MDTNKIEKFTDIRLKNLIDEVPKDLNGRVLRLFSPQMKTSRNNRLEPFNKDLLLGGKKTALSHRDKN